MPEPQPPILALVRDLMFSGRIMAEARAAGAVVKTLRDPQGLLKPEFGDSCLLIADLNLPGAIEAAAQWRQGGGKTVVGFVSHVDAAAIGQANAAGIDQVLPRSRFVQVLPQLLMAKGPNRD
jgi:hypothetical protein